jgi:SPP1 gp7 family putative phage head morphogenesis protein
MAAPDKQSTLAALFGRAPADAVEYLKSKGLRITWNWAEMLDEAHARAFTVAKATNLDVLRDIRRGVIDAVENGKTLRQFSTELKPLLEAKGWWGKKVDVDPVTGEAQLYQAGSFRRLKTIYQTNLQSAYMAGRAKAQAEADGFEYLQYVAVMDEVTRPSHAAMNGQVFRKDDPIWSEMPLPRGHNCRCRTRALTAGQVQREGFAVESSEGRMVTRTVDAGTDKRTGELFPTVQTGVRVTGPDGKPTISWSDPGFRGGPLAGHGMDEVLAKKSVAALDDAAGFAQVESIVNSPTRMRAWDGFIANTLSFGKPQGQTMTAGILPLAVARAMASRDAPFMPVVHVPDTLLVGPKARRHAIEGDAPTREQWGALPASLRGATWYHDTETGDLIAVMEGKMQVSVSRTGRVDTFYRDRAAEEKINTGRWVKVERK